MSKNSNCQLYLISPPEIDLASFSQDLEDILANENIGAFQLRLKNSSDEDIIKAGSKIKDICHKYGTQFILNDRADLAKQIDADGVHIGDDDTDLKQARETLGKNKIIGVSCYDDADKAMQLGNAGADYVSFGAFFATTTKKSKGSPKPDILKFWSTNSILPCTAIGGITPDNLQTLVKNGADFVAVISYVWNHPDSPKKAVKEINQAIGS